ncbi:MAG: acetyl-CoA hydrolase/transferase family protein [Synergistaceae bacterium]|jgi:succinyl-CoA:acetate CoA-transferase|nr:acetyl-CoA hydrolase/transferase family protein [Synergistaceae bacterium]
MSEIDIRELVENKKLRDKITTAEEAARLIKPDTTLGCSGFTPSGYPKVVPTALAKRAEVEGPIPVSIWTGASTGPEMDGELARTHCTKRRYPYQTNDDLRKGINSGEIQFADIHLSHNAQNLRYGFYGKVDVAIIEALRITEDGGIVPTSSVGNSNAFVELADKVIVEVNTVQPEGLYGIHDIYTPENPPNRKPIPISNVHDRIGLPYLTCDPKKIVAIVPSDVKDSQRPLAPEDEISSKMASNLIDFLSVEVKNGRLPKELLPLQSGVGNIANAVLAGLSEWPTDGLTVYTEVIQDAVFELLESGKISFASSTALTPSPDGAAKYYPHINDFKDRIVLRPQEISNNPEVVRRLGIIAMNTAVEVDIYGHINSTMAGGTRMLNGIGGSGDFARNAYLTAFLCPSTSGGGKISKVVPFCSHIDHTEHDVDIIVTEYGIADLRGLSPRERSEEIIKKCAHPDYQELLRDYKRRAELGKGHEPHLLYEAFSWHERLRVIGTMKK